MADGARNQSVRLALLAVLMVFSPLFLGGNRPLPLFVLECLAVFLWLTLLPKAAGLNGLPAGMKPALVCLMGFPLIYLLPMPPGLVDMMPGQSLYQGVNEALGEQGQAWRPLAVYPLLAEYAWLALFVPVVVFVCSQMLEPRRLMQLITLLILMAVAQAILGLVQYGDGPDSVFRLGNPFYPDSAVGTYANRNHLAGLLEMTLPLALAGLAALVGRHNEQRSHRSTFAINKVALYALAVFLILLGLVFTRSRAGVALAIVGLGLCLFAFARRLGGVNALGIVGTLSAIGLGLAAMIGLAPVLQRFANQDALSDVRWDVFSTTFQAIGNYFPLGSGPGTFVAAYLPFQSPELAGVTINHAHNDYLEWLTEGGLWAAAMILLFCWFFLRQWRVLWIREEWSLFRFFQVGAGIGIFLMMLHSLVDFNLRIPANAVYFAFLCGVFFSNARVSDVLVEPKAKQASGHDSANSMFDDKLKPIQSSPDKVTNPFHD